MSVRRGYSLSQTSMTAWIALNSTVRFLLELCALLALMYWGIHTGDSMLRESRCQGRAYTHNKTVIETKARAAQVAVIMTGLEARRHPR